MSGVAPQLAALDALVDELQGEYERLGSERHKLLAGRTIAVAAFPPLALLDVGELRTRADSMLALMEAIDRHMRETLPDLEQLARAGDVAAAKRAVASTTRILQAVGGVSPVEDLAGDTARLVDDVSADAKRVGVGVGVGLFLGALALGALFVVTR